MGTCTIFLLLVVCFSHVMCDLGSRFEHHATLDESNKYHLYWTVDNQIVKFAVEVETTGWVGLGISTGTGMMTKADIIMGWVKDGKGFIQDRFAEGRYLPALDNSQDVDLIAFKEDGGKTTLEFNRKINTCDKKDHPINEGTVRLIWAYNDNDPVSPTSGFVKHTQKGSRSVMLLNSYAGSTTLPDNTLSYEFVNNKAKVPGNDTTYWCQPFKLPDFGGKKHIVQIDPIIQSGNEGIVHHMVLYTCNDNFPDSDLVHSGPCMHPNMPGNITACQKITLYAWALGAGNFSFPEHVGFPVGEADSPKYVVLQTHFDNPQLRTDHVDSSGIRFHVTSQLRQYDGELFATGEIVTPFSMIIPPKQKGFVVKGQCIKECTKQAIPDGGINVFAVMPHTHLVGYSIRARHFRDGKELPSIIHDDNYDFNFQEYQYLTKEKNIQPGDEIITECRYNTMNKNLATLGGASTREEMCLAFMLYYPRSTKFNKCYSANKDVINLAYQNLGHENGTYLKKWTDISPWPASLTTEVKDAYLGDGQVTLICRRIEGEIPGFRTYVDYYDGIKVSETLTEQDECDVVSGAPVLWSEVWISLCCIALLFL